MGGGDGPLRTRGWSVKSAQFGVPGSETIEMLIVVLRSLQGGTVEMDAHTVDVSHRGV
jgi:hypothetical protein